MNKYICLLLLLCLSACGTSAPTEIKIGSSGKNIDFYADYTCPGCKKVFEDTLLPLVQSGKAHITIHDFPLTGAGLFAHNAVWCASKSGKEAEMATYLFKNQDAQRIFQIAGYGESIGLGAAFRTCVEEQEFAATIDRNKTQGEQRGVTLTPTVFIDNKKVETSINSPEITAELSN